MKRTFANLLIASCLASPAFAQSRGGEGPLDAARELYASARYDEALAMLDGLRSSDRRSIEQYRSLCLLALGRTPEAETAIAAVVTADPTFQPSEADASPRVRAAFTEVRQRLLPEIAGAHYAAAKATYDRKEWAAAERQFRDLLTLLNDRDMVGRLADLRTLVSGFLDLATAAAAPPPAPLKPEPAPAPAPAPAPQPPPNKVYGGEDAGVTAPVVIRQDIPAVPANITNQVKDRGRVELVIDEQGRVSSLNLRLPMHPFYDQLIIGAAKEWRYKPATLNGVPVKYRKIIAITLAR
jgi:tetratricopeptide (TPR) repeat protein